MWTTEKPNEPGWYWYCDEEGDLRILRIYRGSGNYLMYFEYSVKSDVLVEELPGQFWIEPVLPPDPPQSVK
jgi:hypothetical protein